MDNAIAGAIHGIGVNAWAVMAAAPASSAAAGNVATLRHRFLTVPKAAPPALAAQRELFSQIAPGSITVSQRIPS
ncbi:hypothetical protein ONR57_02970 [Hoyosella sp. YIM 151337]|uniref:hypothetical protein n=1 Tax=Hoyosella sp. YIM 151337 TaxID=2992742 RepID=UPI002235D97F|nr:hypothetical protein [Hoyosella sp. YIM 151337]MCW4352256.1 hypothetical protein [Hoyosella sp. YIM 151337]